jgi:hypothetical protein
MAQEQNGDVVVRLGTDEVKVEGRVARLIAWLTANGGRVNEPARGNLQVDFAGQSLKFRLTDCFE